MSENRITRRDFIKTGTLAVSAIVMNCSVKNQFDLIIRNGLVVDGSGTAGIRQDIGIINDRIAAIGNLEQATADKSIDAHELVVAPGFIDIHTHTDTELLVNPQAESKIRQGVTTEIGGNCGSSPFPFNEADRKEFADELRDRFELEVDWDNITGFLDRLEKTKISINYATLTGHGDLRSYVIGKNDISTTPEQLQQMKNVLRHSLENGSYGLSTGLEYAPSSYASTDEIIELCKIVSNFNALYATHTRNEDDRVEEAVAEAIDICKAAEVNTQISHLKACNQNNWHKIDNVLQMIEMAIEAQLPVTADRYPYNAYGTGLSTFLPLWARQGTTDDIIARLQDDQSYAKIKTWAAERAARIGGWDRVMISFCYAENNKALEGHNILECARAKNMSPEDFVRNILIEERNRTGIIGFAMNEDNLKKVLKAPFVMVGSDGSAVAPYGKLADGKPHPRYYGTFPRVLGKYGREERLLEYPVLIRKMTSMPAEKIGLSKRGMIKQGFYADITIFDPDTVIDKATFSNPHQYPAGIEYVIVNGKIVIQKNTHTGERAGVVLRKRSR